jgi:uncharacterized protein (DUF58 family)
MNQDTKEALREVIRRVVACPIPIGWRSQEIMPGGGERRSFSKGSNGYDVLARVEYEPGDDPRDIDWAATAQTGGQLVLTTQYMEPRDLKVFVLTDVNPTMNFGTYRTTKRLLAAELTASVIRSAEETQDKVGFFAYSEHHVEASFRPRGAQRAMFSAITHLIEATATAGGEGSGLVKSLARLPRQRSLVFIISDFLNLNDAEKAALKRAALLHDVVAVVIEDRRERELPAGTGIYTLEDIRTGKRKSIWLSAKNRREFAEDFLRHQTALFAALRQAHCTFTVFSTEEGDAAIPKMMRLFGGHRR